MDDVKLTNAVMKLDLFEGVAFEEIERILDAAQRRSLKTGDVLCDLDTVDEELFVFVDGGLRLETGEGVSLAAVRHVRILGEMGVLTGQPRNSRVVAEMDSTVLALSRDDLQNLVDESPDLGQRLLVNLCKVVYGRLHEANGQMTQLRQRNDLLRARLAELAPDDPLTRDD